MYHDAAICNHARHGETRVTPHVIVSQLFPHVWRSWYSIIEPPSSLRMQAKSDRKAISSHETVWKARPELCLKAIKFSLHSLSPSCMLFTNVGCWSRISTLFCFAFLVFYLIDSSPPLFGTSTYEKCTQLQLLLSTSTDVFTYVSHNCGYTTTRSYKVELEEYMCVRY